MFYNGGCRYSMLTIPIADRRTRLLTMAYGLILFLWLTPEDNRVWPVALLGAGLAGVLLVRWVLNTLGGKAVAARWIVPGALLLGILAGAGACVATVGLMFFKNALHAHVFVDFPAPLMLAMLERAPVWAAAGGLVGLGAALAWLALRQEGHEPGDHHP